jgi:hypothetical protein
MKPPDACFPVSRPLESGNWETACNRLTSKELLFPAGTLSESRSGKQEIHSGTATGVAVI